MLTMADLSTYPTLVYISQVQSGLIQAFAGIVAEDVQIQYHYTVESESRNLS